MGWQRQLDPERGRYPGRQDRLGNRHWNYTVDSNGRFSRLYNGLWSPCGYLTSFNTGFGIGASAVGLFQNQTGAPFGLGAFQGAYSVGSKWSVTASIDFRIV